MTAAHSNEVPTAPLPAGCELTERQQQCLRGVLERKTAKEIGLELGISHHAVEKHLKAARRKFGGADTLKAARLYWLTTGSDGPYCGSSDIHFDGGSALGQVRPGARHDSMSWRLRDVATEGQGLAYRLTAGQTLIAISLASLGLAAVLALLIAIAQGIATLTS